MDEDYDEKHWDGVDQMDRDSEAGDEPENPEQVLRECAEKFATSDYIMEPGIFSQLKRYFQSGGDPLQVIEELSQNYTAVAQMANLIAEWLIIGGVKVTDVQAMVENHLKEMILKTFDPKKADTIFTEEGETPAWLTQLIEHPTWRSLIYRLAEEYPDCLMLNFTIKLISDAGFQGEITSISTAAQQLEVFSRVLKTSISSFLTNPEDWQKYSKECAKMVCHGQHTYVYSQVIIHILARESKGGSSMKRLSQEITKCAQKNGNDVTPITMALNGASAYPQACQALTAMLSKNTLNPADITVLFRNYNGSDPPPIDLIRTPQFLELLIDALFKPGVKLNPDHKPKYIHLLAYAASVSEIQAKKGQKRMSNRDELQPTVRAIETVHTICNGNKGSSELMADLAVLYQSLRKDTNTSRYIDNSSECPTEHKMASFNFMINRLFNFPLSADRFNKELALIHNIAKDNGYPSSLIDRLYTKIKYKKFVRDCTTFRRDDEEVKYGVLSFAPQLTKGLKTIFQKLGLKLVFKSRNQLRSLLGNPKDKQEQLEKSGIYSITCTDCRQVYVGQTRRSIHTRFKEHMAHLKYGRIEKSSVAQHAFECNHRINIDNLKLIKSVNRIRELDIIESIEIRKLSNPMNRDNGHYLSNLFDLLDRFPVVSVGVIRWVECTVTEASYFKLSTEHTPIHLALLDEVVTSHPLLHNQVLELLIRLFESKQDELEILVQLEMRKMVLDRMVNLLCSGCVVPVVKYIKQCWQRGDTDISLIRYFVTEVLETIGPPYSTEFVHLFMPMVENDEITGTMRGDGENDPVSEFIVYCKANYTTLV